MQIKFTLHALLLSIFIVMSGVNAIGQTGSFPTEIDSSKVYIVEMNDGSVIIGTIVQMDSKEVLIISKEKGEVSLPKYQVKSIQILTEDDLNAEGEYVPNEVFATRYFITTNGLPVEKGENYVLWNIYGPEVHFGVSKNFGAGIMSSWVGMPFIGTAKYSIELGKKAHIGIGMLAGT